MFDKPTFGMHSSSGIVVFSLNESLRNQKTAFLSESRF